MSYASSFCYHATCTRKQTLIVLVNSQIKMDYRIQKKRLWSQLANELIKLDDKLNRR